MKPSLFFPTIALPLPGLTDTWRTVRLLALVLTSGVCSVGPEAVAQPATSAKTFLIASEDLTETAQAYANRIGQFEVVPRKGSAACLSEMLKTENPTLAIVRKQALDRLLMDSPEVGNSELQNRLTNFMVLKQLNSETIHLLVTADSDIKTVEDLAGKRIGIEDSNDLMLIAGDITEAYGVAWIPVKLSLEDSLEQLKAGEVAAVLQFGSVAGEGLRPLSLWKKPLNFYLHATITVGVFPAVSDEVTSIATRYAIIGCNLTPAEVTRVRRLLGP